YKAAFLIFDVVDRGGGPPKTMVIPFQGKSTEKIYAGFYQTSGILGIFNKNRDQVAVVLEYLTEWKELNHIAGTVVTKLAERAAKHFAKDGESNKNLNGGVW